MNMFAFTNSDLQSPALKIANIITRRGAGIFAVVGRHITLCHHDMIVPRCRLNAPAE